MTTPAVDVQDLERRVKDVYREVALSPERTYHFEMGRRLAERLGYPSDVLDQVPASALDSSAGVGYYLDLAAPVAGDRVLDLGSGSGTDSSALAHLVGVDGHVTGVDMTDEQLAKAERLRAEMGRQNVEFGPWLYPGPARGSPPNPGQDQRSGRSRAQCATNASAR